LKKSSLVYIFRVLYRATATVASYDQG
jgi:hypothetical protein